MSLPDTVFIFVLALIIFGPKKLPEIGRQLGKLVGEFRRASNEFKFQIEEELRQAEFADRNTIAPAKKELETSASAEASTEALRFSLHRICRYPEETLPVGQYPNIDTVNPTGFEPGRIDRSGRLLLTLARSAAGCREQRGTAHNQPCSRRGAPHNAPLQLLRPTPEPESRSSQYSIAGDHAASLPNHEPADPYAAPAVADVTHG